MKTVLVSMISDQTIPNLLVIKELEERYDELLFVSTSKMEEDGKSCWIEKAIDKELLSTQRVVVDESNWCSIRDKLNTTVETSNVRYIVNLTGGTKIMTLAVYEFFARSGNQIVYVPIGKNIIEELYPMKDATPVEIQTRLNVQQYLSAHGINFIKKDSTLKSFNDLKTIYKVFKNKGFDINSLNEGYPQEWKNYYTGGWFEEYLFYKIKEDLQLNDGYIIQGVELMHFNEIRATGNDQELDLVFTIDNAMFLLEAKVSLGRTIIKSDLLHQYLFKLSAINKNFGLRSNPYLVTLADMKSRSGLFQTDTARKAKVLGIRGIIDRNQLINPQFSFKQIFE